mmetsp:Transcript_83439/g.236499  ORF Transcript_83439/g.236499 Transcript_83439/m.236499 type:complete len:215 (+) Transcript_83439:398-1042(+)
MRRVADLHATRDAVALHLLGVAHGRAEEVVARALLAHDARHDGARVEAHAHLHRGVVADARQRALQRQGHLDRAHRVLRGVRLTLAGRGRAAGGHKVGVANDLDLVQRPVRDDLVEGRVHGVQHRDQLVRRDAGRVGGETFDVGEDDRDARVMLRNGRDTLANQLHDMRRQQVGEERGAGSLGSLDFIQSPSRSALLVVGDVLQVLLQVHPACH